MWLVVVCTGAPGGMCARPPAGRQGALVITCMLLCVAAEFGDRENSLTPLREQPKCSRFVLISTQRSGTTSLGSDIWGAGITFTAEATNMPVYGNATKYPGYESLYYKRKNLADFAEKLWETKDFAPPDTGSCAMGISMLADATTGCNLRVHSGKSTTTICKGSKFVPLFGLNDTRIVVVERADIHAKWFSHERACITGDWGGHSGNASNTKQKAQAYLEKHQYCYNPFNAYARAHSAFYDVLRPLCVPPGCLWIKSETLFKVKEARAQLVETLKTGTLPTPIPKYFAQAADWHWDWRRLHDFQCSN